MRPRATRPLRGRPGAIRAAASCAHSVADGSTSLGRAMVVHVRLFAALRERAGRDQLEVELPDGARVADALAAVGDLARGLPLVLAVNREYAPQDQLLHAGDELALIPPVSGGAATAPHVAVRSEPLSLDALAAAVRDPRAGAVVTFSGVTRA